MREQWIKERCPKCSKTNWLNNGDTSDLTVPDIEGCECWACGHQWAFDDAVDDPGECSLNIEKGREYAG